jgi:hypothetical protein
MADTWGGGSSSSSSSSSSGTGSGNAGGDGFDGFGDSRSQGGFGGRGYGTGRADGGDKDDFGKAVTPTSQQHGKGLSPGQAQAIFGKQIGPALAGRKGFTATDASQLAARMNIGQIANVPSVMAHIANEFGKMMAKNMVEELAFNPNAKAVRDQFGNITGVSTDERGLIWGRDPSEFQYNDRGDGPKTATFTPSPSTPAPSTAVDSGSNASLIPSSKARGTPDSSGSGRRSMFGQVVKR